MALDLTAIIPSRSRYRLCSRLRAKVAVQLNDRPSSEHRILTSSVMPVVRDMVVIYGVCISSLPFLFCHVLW